MAIVNDWNSFSSTSATSSTMYYNRTVKFDDLFGPELMKTLKKSENQKSEKEKETVEPLSFDPKELDL